MFIRVPYPSFTRSAECLTDHDLHQMCNDALVGIRQLWEQQSGLLEAVAVDAAVWFGFPGALVQYARALDFEHRRRTLPSAARLDDPWLVRGWLESYMRYFAPETWLMPHWFGDAAYHATQRASLRAHDSDAYVGLSDVTAAGTGYLGAVAANRSIVETARRVRA